MKKLKTKFIFVVGGVMSGVGKGISTASISQILSNKGYNVSAMKIDPYINVDAGTMNPAEHGEVFVTEDGDQTDQDIGNYERFLNKDIKSVNYMTTGRVYQSVIARERNLEYKGKCVQVIPHIPMEVRDRIDKAVKETKAEIVVIEVGGTVGEYENLLFLEAARVMKLKNPGDVLFVMVSYLPVPNKVGEMKTKPTQHAVRSLNTAGIQPNFIIARSEVDIDDIRRGKIAIHCNVLKEDVITAPDIDSIYEVPLNFEKNNFANKILKKLNLKPKNSLLGKENAKKWLAMINQMNSPKREIKIGLLGDCFNVGNFSLKDSYLSLTEAIRHAAIYNRVKVNIEWIDTKDLKKEGLLLIKKIDGLLIPQGWGEEGLTEKVQAINYCRTKKIPYLGLGCGMQMAIVEFARNVCQIKDATSEEFSPQGKNNLFISIASKNKAGKPKVKQPSMRLGSYPCQLVKGTKIEKIYQKNSLKNIINERHRHCYKFNSEFKDLLEKKGLIFSGNSLDGDVVEAVELKAHPFFIGVQYHPEYISRPLNPHPLFVDFVKTIKNIN